MRLKLISASTAAVVAVVFSCTGAVAFAAAGSDGSSPVGAGGGRGKVRKAIAAEAWGVAAETIGIGRKDLAQAVREGGTIAAVAEAHDVDPQTVIDALVAAAAARIDDVAQRRDLDAARVTERMQRAEARITKLVNEGAPATGDRKAPPKGKGRTAIAAEAMDLAAETIGIERKDLVQAVRGGQTIAAVAQAHDIDPQTVVDALVTAADARIDQVAGRRPLDDGRVTALKQKAEQRITKLVNEGRAHKATAPTR